MTSSAYAYATTNATSPPPGLEQNSSSTSSPSASGTDSNSSNISLVSNNGTTSASSSSGSDSTIGNSSQQELVPTSNDSAIIRQTLKVYGSIFLVSFVAFCYLRKSRRYKRLFNVRSWSPELKSSIASPSDDYGWVSWAWRTFWDVSDDDLLEHCGMDAISFLRALKFGRHLSYVCCLNAIWLIPLYATAEDSPETSYLQDPFVLISISNLPSQSPRFLGTVVAAYLTFFYAMYLLHREARWFTKYRHKFLAQRRPRNYAVYVSGIPLQYRSSYDLAQYFRSCSSQDSVLEAHVAMNIPDLESKVAKRDALVRAVEHTVALERRRGKTKTHRRLDPRRGTLERVETLASLERELRHLDRDIELSTRQILNSNDPFRSKLVKERAIKRLFVGATVEEAGEQATFPPLRERKKTIDYDHGDEMDDELKRILDPDSEHAYDDPNDVGACHQDECDDRDLEANFSSSFDSTWRDPDASSSHRAIDDDELLEVLEPCSSTFPSTSTLGRYSAATTEAIEEEELESQQESAESSIHRADEHDESPNDATTAFDNSPASVRSPRSPASEESFAALPEEKSGRGAMPAPGAAASLVRELNSVLGAPSLPVNPSLGDQTSTSRQDSGVGTEIPKSDRPKLADDYRGWSRLVEQGSVYTGSESDPSLPASSEEQGAQGQNGELEETGIRVTLPTERQSFLPTSGRWSDRSGGSGRDLSPIREVTVDPTRAQSKISLMSEPRSDGPADVDDPEESQLVIPREDSFSHLSVHSDMSGRSSSRGSGLLSTFSTGSKAVVTTSRRASSSLVSAGSTVMKGSVAASYSLAKGSRAASMSIVEGSKEVSKSIAKGSRVASEAIRKVAKDTSMDKVLESVGETGLKTIKTAHTIGSHVVTSAATVVPLLASKASGSARDAGFVVFTNLFTAQSALQMIHHPKPTTMNVQEAPDPKDIFWRNVGMPHRARRTGMALSVAASAALCIFWSIPIAFISSLTAVNSLKNALPRLGEFVDTHPWVESILALLAPLLLLLINETVLPYLLKFFATWEGHISSAVLEASLFLKLGCFMIIQTFFVSAISGSISAELENIINNPASVVTLLANSLPAQSSYFMQILLTSTFLLQATELLRVYPLTLAFLRRFLGPNLTEKERRRSWGLLRSLEDPPDFWHAETFAQIILYFVVFFVYACVAPICGFFLLFCFLLMESGYRYQYIHNYPPAFETGGKLWRYFVHFTLASMIIGQLTLMGLLLLKQSFYAVPALGPLLAITILFTLFLNHENGRVMSHLPTRDCVVLDDRFLQEGHALDFLVNSYLQPALKAELTEPEYNVDDEAD